MHCRQSTVFQSLLSARGAHIPALSPVPPGGQRRQQPVEPGATDACRLGTGEVRVASDVATDNNTPPQPTKTCRPCRWSLV